MKKIGIGVSDFKKLIKEDCYYVDKTQMIEDLIKSANKVIEFPRPRRFGKTLTMSMLKYFFNVEGSTENKNLFDGLYISNNKDLCNKYQGSMPVISISFKDLKESNFDDFFDSFKGMVSDLYKEHKYIREALDDSDKKFFDRIENEEESTVDAKKAIANMINYLYKYYNSEEYKSNHAEYNGKEVQVLLLIDEYDVPIQEAYSRTEILDDPNGFYAQVVGFIRTVFSRAAKDNSDKLFKAIFTGVLRVSQESIFSDLNNFKVYGLMNSSFDEHFGFTESQTKEMLEYYGLELTKEVKDMYDGYTFNEVNVYNPWSILNYAEDKVLNPYWINTSSNGLIKEMLTTATSNVKGVIEKLIQGESVVFVYDEKLTYRNLRNNNDLNSILNMMFASGYLTYDETEHTNFGDEVYIKVPNKEVNEMLVKMTLENVYGSVSSSGIRELTNAVESYDLITVEKVINEVLASASFMDLVNENGYHAFMIGFFGLYLNNDNYIVKSNREGGSGRFDVMIERTNREYGYIFEFKIAGSDEDMESVAKNALEQIEDKEYYQELELDKVRDIRKVAIVFSKKKCIVR